MLKGGVVSCQVFLHLVGDEKACLGFSIQWHELLKSCVLSWWIEGESLMNCFFFLGWRGWCCYPGEGDGHTEFEVQEYWIQKHSR